MHHVTIRYTKRVEMLHKFQLGMFKIRNRTFTLRKCCKGKVIKIDKHAIAACKSSEKE